jgi:hypothetical protein
MVYYYYEGDYYFTLLGLVYVCVYLYNPNGFSSMLELN